MIMRILLNTALPSDEELRLFTAMGIDVRNIKDQYRGRHYYVETESAAFERRSEMTGLANATIKTTISFNGIDVMTIQKCTLFGGGFNMFKLHNENVELALSLEVAASVVPDELSDIFKLE